MAQEIFQVDAFTDTPFKGNPAAVCALVEAVDERWMQRLANEMNLSETAFEAGLHPAGQHLQSRFYGYQPGCFRQIRFCFAVFRTGSRD
jgi:PhzF family phenazine biosynthesis protein